MAAYRRVYDSRYLQADCQEPGSAPEPYARQSSMGYLYFFTIPHNLQNDRSYEPAAQQSLENAFALDQRSLLMAPVSMLKWIYTVSQKTRHQTLGHNFTKYYPIFKIFY